MLGRCRTAIILLATFAFILAFALPSQAILRIFEGVVKKVADEDTLTVAIRDAAQLRVRLYGIDAPEIRHEKKPAQPYGEEAKAVLMALTLGKTVKVEIIEIDRYKRIVGIVHENDLNINRQLVKDGYAWAYREYLKGAYASEFINFERQAREKHLGLWQQSNPTPPWEYRRRNC